MTCSSFKNLAQEMFMHVYVYKNTSQGTETPTLPLLKNLRCII